MKITQKIRSWQNIKKQKKFRLKKKNKWCESNVRILHIPGESSWSGFFFRHLPSEVFILFGPRTCRFILWSSSAWVFPPTDGDGRREESHAIAGNLDSFQSTPLKIVLTLSCPAWCTKKKCKRPKGLEKWDFYAFPFWKWKEVFFSQLKF